MTSLVSALIGGGVGGGGSLAWVRADYQREVALARAETARVEGRLEAFVQVYQADTLARGRIAAMIDVLREDVAEIRTEAAGNRRRAEDLRDRLRGMR